jgi:hypothetical protein
MSKYSWGKYNEINTKLSNEIMKFNNLNKINFFEAGLYNHIRDIFCLTILFNRKIKGKTKILDYGSNLLALSNIRSKLDVKLFDFSIYDPFSFKKNKNIKKPFKIKFFFNANKLKFNKFHIVNFGSSLQYIKNIKSLEKTINFKSVKTILITHTPITLSDKYESKQKNHKSLTQNIHSLFNVKKYFNKIGFSLIFKSRNDDKYIACKKKQKKTYSLNLIFVKKK